MPLSPDCEFLKKWDRLIDLEEGDTLGRRAEIWSTLGARTLQGGTGPYRVGARWRIAGRDWALPCGSALTHCREGMAPPCGSALAQLKEGLHALCAVHACWHGIEAAWWGEIESGQEWLPYVVPLS